MKDKKRIVEGVIGLIVLVAVLRWASRPQKRSKNDNPADTDKDDSCRETVRKKWLETDDAWKKERRERKKRSAENRLKEHDDQEKRIGTPAIKQPETHEKSSCETGSDESLVEPILSCVYDDGLTVFRHIPQLPEADIVAKHLQQIADEFMPIVRKRGYDVRVVSEFCCCEDGIEYELGGTGRCIRPGCNIAGHDAKDVLGYNRLESMRGRRKVHTIHLRLRSPHNHTILRPYSEVVRTMAHELAHCIHRHHGPAFRSLRDEILDDYYSQRARTTATENTETTDDKEASSREHFGGFNVYGSCASTAYK